MRKKALSLALALVMCLGLVVPVFAAGISDTAGVNLTRGERRIYEAMENAVLEIVSGRRTSTEITVKFADRELGWSAQELGFSSIHNDYAAEPVSQKLTESLNKVYTCIEYNHPFEFFFTRAYAWNCSNCNWWNAGSELWITDMTCSLTVTPAYQGDSAITVDPAKIARAVSVESTARAIVRANEGKSNYDKLLAYRDAICELTDYNHVAYSECQAQTYIYGDPSQLIYVFDGDPNTKVMCEGYSKAFKYLCDLSSFDGDVHCYLAEGDLSGGDHMWNVVRMEDGNYYFTDVTVYDLGRWGENVPLLATASEDAANYNYQPALYTYRSSGYGIQYGLFTNGYLPISATSYEPGHAVTPQKPTTPINPTTPTQPAKTTTASPTNDKLEVNGNAANPTVYKIDGSNYFKIRDVAALLDGTEKQFAVGYDGGKQSVTATTGQGYDKQPGDLAGAPAGGNKTAAVSNDAIYVNGQKVEAQVYKIDGSNYFKLRDLGKALDFYVGWSADRGMYIETGKPYSE